MSTTTKPLKRRYRFAYALLAYTIWVVGYWAWFSYTNQTLSPIEWPSHDAALFFFVAINVGIGPAAITYFSLEE
jgi:hypothetical protein